MRPIEWQPLARAFFDRDAAVVARELVGKLLVRRTRDGQCAGRIVETEAYLAQGDTACHAARGRNRKNAVMFGPPGRAYVYTIHARYCLNAVTERAGVPSAVLIRAVEPWVGLPLMQRRRATPLARDLCRGPARLCEAFSVHRSCNGWDLCRGKRLWIAAATGAIEFPGSTSAAAAVEVVAQSIRIGVTSAEELPLRFFLPGNPFVSGPGKLNQVGWW